MTVLGHSGDLSYRKLVPLTGHLAGPAVANSIHDEGDFGGGYRLIGPGGPERHDYLPHQVFRPNDEARPFYSYGYGPAWSYDYYGPAIAYGPVITIY